MNQNSSLENTQSDEVSEFKSQLTAQAGEPDTKFVGQLKAKSLRSYLGQNWLTLHLWRNLAIGAFALSAVVIVGIFVINRSVPNSPTTLNSQTKEVLSKVFSNNPQSLLALKNQTPTSDLQATRSQASTPETANATGSGGVPTPLDLTPQYLKAKSFNYSYSKSEVKSGPALDKCPVYALGQEGTVESYVFVGDTNTQSKTITYDSANNLTDYYLYGSEYAITYKGGKYAVKTIYPAVNTITPNPVDIVTPESASGSAGTSSLSALDQAISSAIAQQGQKTSASSATSSVSADDVALNFFGDNAQVSDKQTENGQDFYEVTWDTTVNCNLTGLIEPVAVSVDNAGSTAVSITNDATKIVNRVRVDANTYNVFQEERYLDEISPDNLLQTSKNETKTQQVDFSEVQKNFEFEFSVPVKEVTINYDAYNPTTVTKNLAAQDIAILALDTADSSLTGLSMPLQSESVINNNFGYTTDRDFYPRDARGDALYRAAVDYQQRVKDTQKVVPLVNANYSSANLGLNLVLNVYNSDADTSAVIKNFVPTSATKLANFSSTINGQAISWQAYETKITSGGSTPPVRPLDSGSGEGSSGNSGAADASNVSNPPDAISFTTTYLIGSYYHNYYVLILNGDLSKLKLKALVTSKAADMQALTTQLSDGVKTVTTEPAPAAEPTVPNKNKTK